MVLPLNCSGVYKVPYSTPWGGWGKFIKSFGEEFQFVKRGSDFKGFWGENYVEKRVRGSNIICSIILRLQGRLSSGEEEIWGKKIKILKNRVGKEYKIVGNFIHPCNCLLIWIVLSIDCILYNF